MRKEHPSATVPEPARWGLWLALGASVLGTAASLASSRGLEWLASAGLLCGALVLVAAARCPGCGRSRLTEVLLGRGGARCACRRSLPE